MSYNPLHKLQDNIAALRFTLDSRENTEFSEAALDLLKKYSGFGGIKAVLYGDGGVESWKKQGATDADLKLWEDFQRLYSLLKESFTQIEYAKILDSLKISVLTAFYTPYVVPKSIYKALKELQITPKCIYEPSAGAGIFLSEAIRQFPELTSATVVEKDILTGKILQKRTGQLNIATKIYISSFEEAPTIDNGEYDIIVSNIPFGNFTVYDPDFPEKHLTNRIHNYFFAKGLEKIGEGGLLAYITTDGFLNAPGNSKARRYLFTHADFVSLTVMPDNLMKETGGTEAPSHLLLVQKNTGKVNLSPAEQLLLESTAISSEQGEYFLNAYIDKHRELLLGSEISVQPNQYGKPHLSVWQQGIEEIAIELTNRVRDDISMNFNKERFDQLQLRLSESAHAKQISLVKAKPQLTYQPMPEDKENTQQHTPSPTGMQLGLFDNLPDTATGRVAAYLMDKDAEIISASTAKLSSIIRSSDRPEHELVVLITAKALRGNGYLHKLKSNAREINFPDQWLRGKTLVTALEQLARKLSAFGHEYLYDGDQSLESAFMLKSTKEPETDAGVVTGLPLHFKENTLLIYHGKVGVISGLDVETNTARFEPFLPPEQHLAFYRKYIAVRDTYFELFRQEQDTQREASVLRVKLNQAYGSFVSQYGPLNLTANKRKILNDEALGFVTLSSVERKEELRYIASDILKGYLRPIVSDLSTDDPIEALAFSLNRTGKVDLDYISSITGKEVQEVIYALEGQIYYNPIIEKWEAADKFLSGNVVQKLRRIEEIKTERKETEDLQLQRSFEALQAVQPRKIAFELLDFNLGERWIPMEYYERFVSKFFEMDSKVIYLRSMDSFKVKVESRNTLIDTEYAIKPRNGHNMYGNTLMEHALENTNPFFTYKEELLDGTEVTRPDNDSTQLAFSKIESIRTAFTEWMRELPIEEKQEIEDLYNDKYNSYVLRKYDGSHLTFPGLDLKALGIDRLYSSQKDAAWRIIEEKGALIDHIVGLGKTLTMIITSQEMKRLGIIHKPMILGLKANVPEIAETYQKAYPAARILYPGQKDFTPKNRQRIFHEIKNNNWDCIILTHNQFEAIEQSPEIQKDILEKELYGLEADLDLLHDMTNNRPSKQEFKGLEVRKLNLTAKIKVATHRLDQKRDQDIDFKSMAIDLLFVDESHKFKNLTFTTRHTRVAGLGNPQGSQRALNMLFAVRTLQHHYNDDKGVVFLSGTPISNSLTELYLIFKYLRPRALERLNMSHFDGWAAVHAQKTVDFEFSVTNEIIAKERFRHFIKVPELALFYNEITDYKTDKHIKQDRPELEEVLVNIKPTEEQEQFIGKLIGFAKTGDARLVGLPPLNQEEDKARILIATNLAKKMAVDMRLINPYLYGDDAGSKISACARKFAEIYHNGAAHKVTQIVFCDIGTPKPSTFNIYDALRNKLVEEFGIPREEIAFIHEWQGLNKRLELFKKVNAGEIRGLIGSTEMAGTGLNVQKRLIAEHDLDVPWTPKDMEQRTGRMQRPGNEIAKKYYGNKVTAYRYATEKSLDNYKFNLLKNKQTFIAQLKNNELQVRTLDEGAIDDKTGMNFSEYVAILSGDITLLEKSRLEKKIKALENLKAVHYNQIAEAKWQKDDALKEKKKVEETLQALTDDLAHYNGLLQHTREGTKANPIRLFNREDSTVEELGRFLIQLQQNWLPKGDSACKIIGSLYGFDCYIERAKEWNFNKGEYREESFNKLYAKRSEGWIKYSYNGGIANNTNPKLAARYFLESIDRIGLLKDKESDKLSKLDEQIRQLEQMTGKPFDSEEKLTGFKEDLAGLERKIAIQIEEAKLENENRKAVDSEEEPEIIKIIDEPAKGPIKSDIKLLSETDEFVTIKRITTPLPRAPSNLRITEGSYIRARRT